METSMEEVVLGSLSAPIFPTDMLLSELGVMCRSSLVPTVHVVDDLLEGGQNATVGYQYTHRPATLLTV